MNGVFKLKPFISHTVWGGTKLAKLKSIDSIKPIGETWEVSTLKQGASSINEQNLSEVLSLNYLVKFIDTQDNLSIQVHPDDEYANINENCSGKTECWIILDSEDDAGIYLGFKPGITKKEFFNALNSGLSIDQFLNFIPVKKGDFFFLPPGSVHAIGKNITLCEIQQSSGITYRVWDWGRMGLDGKPRQLHIEKAKDVLNFQDKFNQNILSLSKKNILSHEGIQNIANHPDFKVQLFVNGTEKELEINLEKSNSIIVLEGALSGDIELEAYESAIVMDAGVKSVNLASSTKFIVVS